MKTKEDLEIENLKLRGELANLVMKIAEIEKQKTFFLQQALRFRYLLNCITEDAPQVEAPQDLTHTR